MKRDYLWASLLGVAALLASCSNDEDLVTQTPAKTYAATVDISKGDVEGDWDTADGQQDTRALFFGGNTNRYMTVWDKNDVIQVYDHTGALTGTMSLNDAANSEYQGTKDAYLTGTLTGDFSQAATFYMPTKNRDYTGQNGTIFYLSANCSYQFQTVGVESVSGTTVKFAKANMNHRQAYLRLQLMDEEGNRLHPSQLTISASPTSANRIVTSVAEDGTTMTYGDIVINTVKENGEYPGDIYVAILNEGYNETKLTHGKVDYRFTAVVDGEIYEGPSDKALNAAPSIGKLSNVARKMTKTGATTYTATASFASSQMTLMQGSAKLRTDVSVDLDGTDVTDQCTFTYTSSDYSVAAVNPTTGVVVGATPGTATITALSQPYGAVATYTVTVYAPVDAEDAANYVDLGLPSGTLWAKKNVGAASTSDAGTYFAWGEWDGWSAATDFNRAEFTSENYVTGSSSSAGASATTSAYTYQDGTSANLLDRTFDAATQNYGPGWEMPTDAEWQELLDTKASGLCTWTWNGNGYWEIKSTLTKQTLTLPAAGYKNGAVTGLKSQGYYWSSAAGATGKAKSASFTSSAVTSPADADRWHGRTVRAVKAKQTFNWTVTLKKMNAQEWKEWKPTVELQDMVDGGVLSTAAEDAAAGSGGGDIPDAVKKRRAGK